MKLQDYLCRIIHHPDELSKHWDSENTCYFSGKKFLWLLHTYNPCKQKYYELYYKNTFVAGTIVYLLKINLFTYSFLNLPVKMTVVGIPASVSSSPLIGKPEHFSYLISLILKKERGLTVVLNPDEKTKAMKAVGMRTLPSVIFNNVFQDIIEYRNALRHHYRRKQLIHERKFSGIKTDVSDCMSFTQAHYNQYLQVINYSKTRLETLTEEFFQNLPENFVLISHYTNQKLIAWNICCIDNQILYFLFGGMDYSLRDSYCSYHNNLYSILKFAFKNKINTIDFGQTAELVKVRLGGKSVEKIMLMYHRNILIRLFIVMFKKLISYSKKQERVRVFKKTSEVQ